MRVQSPLKLHHHVASPPFGVPGRETMAKRSAPIQERLGWWRCRPWWRKFTAKIHKKHQHRQPDRSTSKTRWDGSAPDEHNGGTPPNHGRQAKAAVRELSDISRELFCSSPPPPPPPPPILKQCPARTACASEVTSQLESEIAALKRLHAIQQIRLLARYTTLLAAYNPEKWRAISQHYRDCLSNMTARSLH